MEPDSTPADLHDTLVDDHVTVARRFTIAAMRECCVISDEDARRLREELPTLRVADFSKTRRSGAKPPAPGRSAPPPLAPILEPDAAPIVCRNPVMMLEPDQVRSIFAAAQRRRMMRHARAVLLLVLSGCVVGGLLSFALRVLHLA